MRWEHEEKNESRDETKERWALIHFLSHSLCVFTVYKSPIEMNPLRNKVACNTNTKLENVEEREISTDEESINKSRIRNKRIGKREIVQSRRYALFFSIGRSMNTSPDTKTGTHSLKGQKNWFEQARNGMMIKKYTILQGQEQEKQTQFAVICPINSERKAFFFG